IDWLYNGKPLSSKQRVNWKTSDDNNVLSLIIPKSEKNDGGEFTCRASIPTSEVSTKATVVIRPQSSKQPDISSDSNLYFVKKLSDITVSFTRLRILITAVLSMHSTIRHFACY